MSSCPTAPGGRRAVLRLPVCCALLALGGAAWSQSPVAPAWRRHDVVLLQPSAVLEARVPDVDAMAAYIRAVEQAASEGVLASEARQATGGFLVLAVRAGRESRAWLDMDTLLDLTLRQQLLRRVQAVPAFEVREGPVVFALKFSTWGGKPTRRLVPSPPEWRAVRGEGPPLEVSELALRAWEQAAPP